jgi:hypothetical protein
MALRTLIMILVVACAALVLMKVREFFDVNPSYDKTFSSYENPMTGYLVNKYGLGIFGYGAKPATHYVGSGGDWGTTKEDTKSNINFENKLADQYVADYLARRDAAGALLPSKPKDLSTYRALSPQLAEMYDQSAVIPSEIQTPEPTAAVGADSKTYAAPLTPEAIKSAYTSLRPQLQADIQDAVKNEMLVSRATKAAATGVGSTKADSDGLYQGAEFTAAKKRKPAGPCPDPNPNCPCSKRGCGGGEYCPCAGSGAGRCSGGGASAGGNGATPCNVPQDSTSCAPFDSSKYIRKDSIPCWKCNLA